MPTRQHILAGVFIVGLLGYLGNWAYQALVADRIDAKTQAIERARKSATSRKRELIESQAAKLELEKWRKLSLPPDPNAATPQYQAFLLDLLEQCGFDRPTITPGAASLREDTYWRIPFEVQARGSMSALVTFLDAFYRTQLLHKLTQLSMSPIELNGKDALELRLTIEALAMVTGAAGGSSTDSAATATGASAQPPSAVSQLLERNLLMRQGPGPAGRPAFQAEQIYLTGTILSARRPEALLFNRATSQSLTWHVGEMVSAGDFQGELLDIGTNEIVLGGAEGNWFTIALGDNLKSRKPLSAEEALNREIRRSQPPAGSPGR